MYPSRTPQGRRIAPSRIPTATLPILLTWRTKVHRAIPARLGCVGEGLPDPNEAAAARITADRARRSRFDGDRPAGDVERVGRLRRLSGSCDADLLVLQPPWKGLPAHGWGSGWRRVQTRRETSAKTLQLNRSRRGTPLPTLGTPHLQPLRATGPPPHTHMRRSLSSPKILRRRAWASTPRRLLRDRSAAIRRSSLRTRLRVHAVPRQICPIAQALLDAARTKPLADKFANPAVTLTLPATPRVVCLTTAGDGCS
jgi:hypothetical protein